jgi:hypothetical protein
MTVRKIKFSNSSIKRINDDYVSNNEDLVTGSGTYSIKGMKKTRGLTGTGLSVDIIAEAGNGGNGSPRGGRCAGGAGGGGGGSLFRYSSNNFNFGGIPYSIGSSGTPIGPGPEGPPGPAPAPSGNPTTVFGFPFGSGGGGGQSAFGKWGNPGEPACFNGSGGAGAAAGSIPAPFIAANSNLPAPTAFYSSAGSPGPAGNGAPGGPTGTPAESRAGSPGASTNPNISPFGPFPTGANGFIRFKRR